MFAFDFHTSGNVFTVSERVKINNGVAEISRGECESKMKVALFVFAIDG